MTISQRFSEAERVEVLIPPEGFFEDVRRSKRPLTGFHELVDARGGHLRARCEQENITRIDSR